MDTPHHPHRAPRRKLKKVMKKVDKLNSSSKITLSQKKLRAAINTSLNSTHTVRGLKKNNYSLALKLESVKQESKMLGDERSYLLKENYQLRERAINLECMLGDTEAYINEEVDRKFQDHVQQMKNVIKSLNSHMSNLCVDLEQLAQMCFPRMSSSSQRHTSSISLSNDLESRRESDSGDGYLQAESRGKVTSRKTRSMTQPDISVVMEQSVSEPNYQQQLASSCANMIDIEKRMLTETALPRRVRRSVNRRDRSKEVFVNQEAEFEPQMSENNFFENEDTSDDNIYNSGITAIEQPVSLCVTDSFDEQQSDKIENEQVHSHSKTNKTKKPNLTKHSKPKMPVNGDLHISNEFALNNAHKLMKEMTDKTRQVIMSTEPTDMTSEDQERTIHKISDMELTMPVGAPVLPATSEDLETFRDSLSSVRSRRRTRELPKCSDDQNSSQSSDELFPDAVTMRKLKPGQFKFAVGRKDVGGCRKEIDVNPRRARSKSKKQIAELIQQLPTEEPKSVFDFHDKTPKFVPENADEPLSVYSLADESATSPCVPLRKDKVSRRTQRFSAETEIDPDMDMTEHALLAGVAYSEPLKDSPVNTSKKTTARTSRSRSRRRVIESADRSLKVNEDTIPVTSVEPLNELDNTEKSILLNEGITYSEPLKDSPVKTSKKTTSRTSRSRSRKRVIKSVEPSLPLNEDTISVTSVEPLNELDDTGKPTLLSEGVTYSEPLKDSPVKISKNASRPRASRSRSRRVTRVTDDLLKLNEDERPITSTVPLNELEDTEKPSLFSEQIAYSNPLANPTFTTEKTVRTERSRQLVEDAEHSLKPNVDGLPVTATECLNQEDGTEKFTLLGEGVTYSELLKDSPVKSPKITKRSSKKQTSKSPKSAGHSLISNEESAISNRARSMSRSRLSVSEKVMHISSRSRAQSCERTAMKSKNVDCEEDTNINGSEEDIQSSNEVSGMIQSEEILTVNSTRDRRKNKYKERKSRKIINYVSFTGIDNSDESDQLENEEVELFNSARVKVRGRPRKAREQEAYSSNLTESCEKLSDDFVTGQKGADYEVNNSFTEETKCDDQLHSASEQCSPVIENTQNFEPKDVNDDSDKDSTQRSCRGKSALSTKKPRKRKHQIETEFCPKKIELNDDATSETKAVERIEPAKSIKINKLIPNEGIDDEHASISEVAPIANKTKARSTQNTDKNLKSSGGRSSSPTQLENDEMKRNSDSARPVSEVKGKERVHSLELEDDNDCSMEPRRQRRTKLVTSYAEPSLGKKLRRGDPFTIGAQNVQIFKSPKLQGAKKKKSRGVLESLQNVSVADITIME